MNLKLVETGELRILDFDIETLAAGFADPDWVPQKITAAAWSWIGEDKVDSLVVGKRAYWNRRLRGKKLKPLLAAIAQADILTGHNIARFDLPVLDAECARCLLPPLQPVRILDTIKLKRTKGLKKGQDNLAHNFEIRQRKMDLIWGEWDDAYAEDGWPTVEARCRSDVVQHKQLLEQIRPWLKPARVWTP